MAHLSTSTSAPSLKLHLHFPSSAIRWYQLMLILPLSVCGCYGNVFGSEFGTCDEVNAEMARELKRIQVCSVAADCGLILEGTSCGCTNNLVGHKDYDDARFRGLQGRADELKCATTATDCSCPETNGFVCTNGTCGWNYVK